MTMISKVNRMLERWGDSARITPAAGRDLGRNLGTHC